MKKRALLLAVLLGIATFWDAEAVSGKPDFPEHLYAPTVNVATQKNFDFSKALQKTGQKYFKLTGLTVNPEFRNSKTELFLDGKKLLSTVNMIRRNHGDVIFSFDDDSNPPSVDETAYQKAVDLYKIRWIDFKLDRSVLHWCVGCKWELPAILKVIKKLQDKNPGLIVSLTTEVSDARPANFTGKKQDTFLRYILKVNKDIRARFATYNIEYQTFSKTGKNSRLNVIRYLALKQLKTVYDDNKNFALEKMISITPVLNSQFELTSSEADAIVCISLKNDSRLISLVFQKAEDFYKYSRIFKTFTR